MVVRFTAVLLAVLFWLGVGEARAQGLFDDLSFHDYFSTGRYLEAERIGEKRIRLDADRTTQNLAPLCYVYYKLRRYNKLFTCVKDLEARIAAGDHIHSQATLLGIFFTAEADITPLPHLLKAGALLDFGNPVKALEEGRLGLGKVKEGSEWNDFFSATQYRVELLTVMGIAAVLIGQREEGEHLLKMLNEVKVSFIKGQIRRNLKDLGLAQLNVALSRYEQALEYLKGEHFAFIRMFVDLGAFSDSFATIYALPKGLMIGKSQLELGRIAEAKEALDSVVTHKRAPDQGDVYWIALYERGRVAEREGKPAEAIEYYRRAIEVIEQQRSSLTTEATKIGFVGNKQQVYARSIALLVAAERPAEAFDFVERSKARALVDLLAEKKDFAVRGADAERARLVLADLDRAELDARSLASPSEATGGIQRRSLRVLRDELETVAPELSSLVAVSSVPEKEIRTLLGPDEALIEYYYDDTALYAFVVTAAGVQAIRLERAGLAEQVSELRRALELPWDDSFHGPAQRLNDALIKPLEPRIKAAKLVIVPHGALHYMPFAALLAEGGRYLLDRYALRLTPSASVLKFLRPVSPRPVAGLLAFGNPDLGDSKLDLAFAEGEARVVGGLFPESRVLVRKEASEGNFRKAAAAFQRIHLATHGKFRAESPLDSGLFLAKDGEHDGVLRVAELYTINLDADLVTLSACETALGKIDSGDDVVGLTRGFLYAGARSIVSSLWSVDDRATAALMRAFYENLEKMGKREALRQAQIRTREAFPHPFFWAAFQLIGRPD